MFERGKEADFQLTCYAKKVMILRLSKLRGKKKNYHIICIDAVAEERTCWSEMSNGHGQSLSK